MRKLLSTAALAATSLLAVPAAQALPAAPEIQHPAGNVIKVRDLCGVGWHRGPYGVCRPNVRRYIYGRYVYGPYPPVRCWWVAGPYGARRVCR
jgi:hypothetical protein